MKYYKDKNNTVYAYESDGSQDYIIPYDFLAISEADADALRNPAQTLTQIVDAQILALEATVTQRRLREAALTEAGRAWLADVDAQIAALRAQRV